MRLRAARLAALACLLLFIALSSTAAGANASVDIANFAFDPPTVTINAGETVTWTNRDQAAHSAAFTGGGPKTPILTTGKSASLTFTVAGTFNYVCGIHGAAMMGTVIVRAVATPAPTVAPTVAPTPVPTARPTAAVTIPPTVAPTAEPTSAASSSPTPTASTAPTVTVAPTTAASGAIETAIVVTASQPAANDNGSSPAFVLGAAGLAVLAVIAFALIRLRR